MNDNNETTSVIKPTWTELQTAIYWAASNRARQEIAWNAYKQAKATLTESDAYKAMEDAEKKWHEELTNQHNAEKVQNDLLRLALGITEEVTPTE